MSKEFINWDDVFEEKAAETRKSWDTIDHEKLKEKAELERQRGIALGWFDEDGNPSSSDDDENDEDDEDDDVI
jgi:hypothetical protein